MISKLKREHPFLFTTSIILLCIYCTANLYHWCAVWRYPILYYFPLHTFTVIDARTQKPIEGVVAVYLFEFDLIYSKEDWRSHALDGFGLLTYAVYRKIADFISGTHIDLSGDSYIINVTESASDSDGVVHMKPIGPIRRLRNYYFSSRKAPICVLFKPGYKIRILQYSGSDKSAPWRAIPPWNNNVVALIPFQYDEDSEEQIAREYYENIIFNDLRTPRKRNSLPQLSRYFAAHKGE